MRHVSFSCLFMLVAWLGLDGALSQSSTYGERGSDLGIQVFQQVVSSKPLENVVLSPHGVASILGMLLPGAHGETRKQVLGALRYKKNGKGATCLYKSCLLMSGRIRDLKRPHPSTQGRTRCWGSCTRPWRLSPTRTSCWLPTACSLTRVSPWRRPLLPPTKPTSTARAGDWTSIGPKRLRMKSTDGSATRPKVGVADQRCHQFDKKCLH